jgi:predicted RNase H-like HicB family nuclease
MNYQREKAITLSKNPYKKELVRERTTDNEYIFLAKDPDLEACMAQGETEAEALNNLEEVRIDYFEHLLEFNLPIPKQRVVETKDNAGSNVSIINVPAETFITGQSKKSKKELQDRVFSIIQYS